MFYHATRFLEQDFTVVLINSRYHGCRIGSGSDGKEEYLRQLIRAWRQNSCPKSANCYPFIYDTAADLCSVGDYLLSREDVCPEKLGITGISLGGMHAWFAAAIDTRWKAIAPLIGVQSFKYAINNHCFEARVATLQEVFDAAAGDLSQKKVDCDVVQAVWDRICPGLLQSFDAECSLPLLAPRPVFVGNGEVDPRCPISGVEEAVKQARNSFGGSESWLDLKIYPNVGHCVTEEMWRDCVHFFINAFHDEHGKAGQIGGRPSNDVAGVEVCQKSCTEQPESKTIVQ